MRTMHIVSLVGCCLTALGMLQCNAVLGIEDAQVDPTFEASMTGGTGGSAGTAGTAAGGTGNPGSGSGPVDVPFPGCIDATPNCATCLATCTSFDMQRCLDDKDCRTALDDYRACLGSGCGRDGVAETCREQELFSVGGPLVNELLTCLGTTCIDACAESPLVQMCDLYCACMKHNCATQPIAQDANCVATCRAATSATADGSIAYCRKYHCEFIDTAGAIPATHCNHAIGVNECEVPTPPGQGCSGDKTISGFPCVADAECCSGRCEGQTCV